MKLIQFRQSFEHVVQSNNSQILSPQVFFTARTGDL
uniref:Uncharacterized protein n=1 Tax=Arundo donax TaxID=35708 RepID=A0A0A8XXP9_ARUDO